MGIAIDNNLVKQFEKEVHHLYHGTMSDFEKYFRIKDCKGSNSVQFPRFGSGVARERVNPFSLVQSMNVNQDNVVATVKNYEASEYSDIFKKDQVNYDEIAELQKAVVDAIMRCMFQVVVTGLVAGPAGGYATAQNIPDSVGGANTNLNLAKIQAVAMGMGSDGIPRENRNWMVHSNNIHAFMATTQASSIDYNTQRVLTDGRLDHYYGFNFIEVPSIADGGLPLSGTDRSTFAFDKMAVGIAMNKRPKVTIDYVPERKAHLVSADLSLGVVIVDPKGVYKITCDEV